MDPLYFLESEDLLRFFHCKKTEMSCMEKPHTFLSQLRDHDLIPEDRYQKVSRMKSKENLKKAVYEILDLLERKRPQHIHLFWRCVFEEVIMSQYPTLRLLRNSLMDGSYRFHEPFSEELEKKQTKKNKMKDVSEEEEEEEEELKSVKKKRKQRRQSVCDDDEEEEEQPGPSSLLTPGQRKKSKKICFSSPLKKGQKGDIWTWGLFRSQLPVNCGDLEGSLSKQRLAQGEKCILFQKQWFTPGEFEKRAGKESSKNWKWNIRCNDIPLGKLIEEGQLTSTKYKGGSKKVKKSLFPSDQEVTDEDEEVEEPTEQQQEDEDDKSQTVFRVTCGAEAGTLHKKRFASGTCGKSIRTETSWMTPVEFVKEASCQTDALWRRDIKWEGKPLSVLIQEKKLIHKLLCDCSLCKPDHKDLENQKNDDECCVCKREDGPDLVVCDHCPRSFHQMCHLPQVEDAILGDDKPWMCTFCVFRTTQQWRYSDKLETRAAMSQQISQHMLECHYLLLYLYSVDEEQTFASDSNLVSVIQTPMWFDKVADKLQKKEYQTVGEFVSDVQLIFTNCATYNRDNVELLTSGSRLKELFDGELKRVFNISEQTVD
ncbi:nuclear body protein SP140-like [Anabas testudineus]|uniref:SP110 nuclear body protein, tandem duplicate 1 n=1 Tax=Anabas testudineus TaxID=64144 RepID=A0A7N5ZQZ5_ANATE|nr:nuclear body protein SP140-like [Anabas testudineus]